jgi:hypothetical protein
MNTNLNIKDAFDLLQLENKLETSISPDQESLDKKMVLLSTITWRCTSLC